MINPSININTNEHYKLIYVHARKPKFANSHSHEENIANYQLIKTDELYCKNCKMQHLSYIVSRESFNKIQFNTTCKLELICII